MGRRRRRRSVVHGVLLVDKPAGITSFDVVSRVRRALGEPRVGHTGTLDPMATGLLPICLGQGTKLVPFLTAADKAYLATVALGIATDSYDADGQITWCDPEEAVVQVDAARFEAALAGFRGTIEQRPPAFSAIKVDGERLYEKARRGEAVEVPTRTVTVHALELRAARPPAFEIFVRCSKGTYVRSLGVDIGAALGLGAHLTALRRVESAPFRVEDATPLERVEAEPEAARAAVLGLADAVAHLPTVRLDGGALEDVRQGRRRPFPEAPPGLCRALDPAGRLVAILEARGPEPAPVVRGFPPPASG